VIGERGKSSGCLRGKKGLGGEKLELELKRVSKGIKVTIGTWMVYGVYSVREAYKVLTGGITQP
jgi:hypothetical protein